MKKLKQEYKAYTNEDRHVWTLLFNRQFKTLMQYASVEFLEALREVNFTPDIIPLFEEVDQVLQEATGWQLEVVPGHIPPKDFFQLIEERKFPATTWLRRLDQLDYIEEPDMFHDVFGHVPLLVHADYSNFLQGLSRLARKHDYEPRTIELLSRMYWFTIEFGLINEIGSLRIYGAGILSSHGESEFSVSGKPAYHPFNVERILDTSFRTDVMQDQYFVIESFSQLYHSLYDLETMIEKKLDEVLYVE